MKEKSPLPPFFKGGSQSDTPFFKGGGQTSGSVKVAAIIITYNRLTLLKEAIEALRNQTRKADAIIVVNNSSSDGTSEWLAEQSDLAVITQPNFGSSGGQYTGFKYAFEHGYDWLWVMDDDVEAASDCLEKLMDDPDENLIRTPLRYTTSGGPFFNDTITFNLSNPFKSIWNEIFSKKHLSLERIPATGITFEGPLIHRNIVEKIGYPEKKFFIYADDSEYFIRAAKAGAKIEIFRDARFNRKLDYKAPDKLFDWKTYYVIRNIIAIDVLHGSPIVRLIRPFGYLISWLKRSANIKDIKIVFKAFLDGYFYRSEN
jgi:GT2 family glycosyltransferase